jgi:hypothetical protein
MKNRLLFEKMVLAVAPAVAKYHLNLQLTNKVKGESDFIMHPDTARYIAEDCSDIAAAMVREMENAREQGRGKRLPASAASVIPALDDSKDPDIGIKAKSNGSFSKNGKSKA